MTGVNDSPNLTGESRFQFPWFHNSTSGLLPSYYAKTAYNARFVRKVLTLLNEEVSIKKPREKSDSHGEHVTGVHELHYFS